MYKILFPIFLILSESAIAQPVFEEKWSGDPGFQTDFPPFKAIIKFDDHHWLLTGDDKNNATGQDIFTVQINGSSCLPNEKIQWLRLPGDQIVHAAFTFEGYWLAGQSETPDGRTKGAWLAQLSDSRTLVFDTLFSAKTEGGFYDVVATDSAVIAVGTLDGQLAVAVCRNEAVQLFKLPKSAFATEGRAIAQSANGAILIAGQSGGEKGKSQLKVWHFEPSSGRFREVYNHPEATGWAACKDFHGGIAVAGTTSVRSRPDQLLLVRLAKRNNFPSDSTWIAWDTILSSENAYSGVHDLIQLSNGNLVIAGGGLNNQPFSNCPLFFTATFDPVLKKSHTQFYESKSGGAARAIGRSSPYHVLLAGASGCYADKNGSMIRLEMKDTPDKLPFSSLDQKGFLARVIFDDFLRLRALIFDMNANLSLEKSYLWVNHQPSKIAYKGEKGENITSYNPFSLSDTPVKDACREFWLSGNIPIRRGMLDTIQIKGELGGIPYESQEQIVYGAPALHLVAIGNNYDKLAPLEYADDDAKAICDFFRGQSGISFRDVFVDLLDEEKEISQENIAKLLEQVAARNFDPGDVFIFFMSSHCGAKDGKLLFPYRRPDKFGEFYIDFEADILEKIKNLPCRKLIFLDACQSSADSLEKMPNLPSDPDLLLVASCELGKKSYEHQDWKHGAFTLELLSCLKNRETASLHSLFSTPADIVVHLEKTVAARVETKFGFLQKPRHYGGTKLFNQPLIFHPKN